MATVNNDKVQAPTADYNGQRLFVANQDLESCGFTPVSQAADNPLAVANTFHPRPLSNNWRLERPAQSPADLRPTPLNSLARPVPRWPGTRPSPLPLPFNDPVWTPAPAVIPPSIPPASQRGLLPPTPSSNIILGQEISDKYRGNRLAVRNQSANIPAEQSTSVVSN
jgi:hypothetical protein